MCTNRKWKFFYIFARNNLKILYYLTKRLYCSFKLDADYIPTKEMKRKRSKQDLQSNVNQNNEGEEKKIFKLYEK